jgi:2,3-bisphosphoglycerate-independent phosphoglycerate mutase
VDAIRSCKYDLIVLNYAMVGHTGKLAAAVKAVEAVDIGLGRLAQAVSEADGALLVTADHGNCELMRDPGTGGPHTSHTTNPVPVLLMGGGDVGIAAGRLADISPTLLDLRDSLLRPHMSSSSTKVGAPTGITMNSWRSTL